MFSKFNSCLIKRFSNDQLKGGEGIAAIKKAIDIGYRHFDTAFLYNNEQEVGEAIRDKISEGVIIRSDVFVVTKVKLIINSACCMEFIWIYDIL